MSTQPTVKHHGAYVWLFAAFIIFAYGLLGLFGFKVPGVEQLLVWLENVSGWHIYVAAFSAILIEGLYFVGSFFPGTTLIILLALLSQLQGGVHFLLTILAIYLGWCLAGALNVTVAYLYRNRVQHEDFDTQFVVKDNLFITWFPAFRSTYEVSQIADGGSYWKVLYSAWRVRTIASLGAAIGALIIPYFIDVTQLDNDEGFLSLLLVGSISLIIGIYKLKRNNQ